MKALLHFGIAALVLAVVFASCAGPASYETASFRSVRASGAFELRKYPALKVAATARQGDNESFMRLFRYIDGANQSKEKVSMTTPVFMEAGEMRFVVPDKKRRDTPKPSSSEVAIREIPARTVAVYRFSGRRSEDLERKALAKLREWMDANKLEAAGDPLYAYYDPPWTPGPFRRNEVLVPVRE